MNRSVPEYYEAMIQSKAVYGWQYFFIDTEKIISELGHFNPRYLEYGSYYFKGPQGGATLDEYKSETVTSTAQGVLIQMDTIINRFPKLFPDVDLTFFMQKRDALKEALQTL